MEKYFSYILVISFKFGSFCLIVFAIHRPVSIFISTDTMGINILLTEVLY